MIPRLYVTGDLNAQGAATLSREQAHYLKSVLRRGPGDAVRLFNGRDGEFDGAIQALGKKGGSVCLGDRVREQITEPDLILCFAPVKRGPTELIVQKAVEIGVARLIPVETERANRTRTKSDRLQAIAMEAAEQCGRLSVPEVAGPMSFGEFLTDIAGTRRVMFCDEAGDDPSAEWGGPGGRAAPVLEALARFEGREAAPWAILTGPEGGFTPQEREKLRAFDSVTPVTLGPRILRADTAAIAALSLWQAALGDWTGS